MSPRSSVRARTRPTSSWPRSTAPESFWARQFRGQPPPCAGDGDRHAPADRQRGHEFGVGWGTRQTDPGVGSAALVPLAIGVPARRSHAGPASRRDAVHRVRHAQRRDLRRTRHAGHRVSRGPARTIGGWPCWRIVTASPAICTTSWCNACSRSASACTVSSAWPDRASSPTGPRDWSPISTRRFARSVAASSRCTRSRRIDEPARRSAACGRRGGRHPWFTPGIDLLRPARTRWCRTTLRPDLLAVTREALANVARHAAASPSGSSGRGQRRKRLRLLVKDDGRGAPATLSRTADWPIWTNGRRGGAASSTFSPSLAQVCCCDG